jgi:hypothetical protein
MPAHAQRFKAFMGISIHISGLVLKHLPLFCWQRSWKEMPGKHNFTVCLGAPASRRQEAARNRSLNI